MIKINNWSIVRGDFDPYMAPELITSHLRGDVVDHPELGTTTIRTSPILNAKGRIVYTESGRAYKLGKIAPSYRQWIKKNYSNWNWRNPIKIVEV